MTHPAADLLRAIADGKKMEEGFNIDKVWQKCSSDYALILIGNGHTKYLRIARPMVTRQVSYPEPLRVKPANGTEYWTPTISLDIARKFKWTDGAYDNAILAAGMAFATEADAAEAHKALFGGDK